MRLKQSHESTAEYEGVIIQQETAQGNDICCCWQQEVNHQTQICQAIPLERLSGIQSSIAGRPESFVYFFLWKPNVISSSHVAFSIGLPCHDETNPWNAQD